MKILTKIAILLAVFSSTMAVDLPAKPVKESKRIGNLEVTVSLPSGDLWIGKPFPVEVSVKNVGDSIARFGDTSDFLRNFDVKIFDLTYSQPVGLTRHGRTSRQRMTGRYREISLEPGEVFIFRHPMLGWDFDLSVPARYRIELSWIPSTLRTKPPAVEPDQVRFALEILANPDADLQAQPAGRQVDSSR